MSSLDASAIDTLPPPVACLALAVQLISAAVHVCPHATPLLPLSAPSHAQLGTCALASVGAVFALCCAAAAREASNEALRKQIAFDLSVLAAALCLPSQQPIDDARALAIESECVSELLQRSGQWAPIFEQTLHLNAAVSLCELVTKAHHPHMTVCVDTILPVVCEICCHFDAVHRGAGARALMHVLSHADKVVLRLHTDRILKVHKLTRGMHICDLFACSPDTHNASQTILLTPFRRCSQAADSCLFSYDPTVLVLAAPLAAKCAAVLFLDAQQPLPLPAKVAALSAHPSQLTDSSTSASAYISSPLDIVHSILRCARSEDNLAAKCASLNAAAAVVHAQARQAVGPLLLQPAIDAVASCFRAMAHRRLVMPCRQPLSCTCVAVNSRIFAGLSLLVSACHVCLSAGVPPPTTPALSLSSLAAPSAARVQDHSAVVIPAFQLHARGVLCDSLLRFYAFVCREHAVEASALARAMESAVAPGVDDWGTFRTWCDMQENCCEAVACAVLHMLRRLQAAGDCPGLRETLRAAAEHGGAMPLPLRSLVTALSS